LETDRIQLKTLLLAGVAILAVECLAILFGKTPLDTIILIGIVRCAEVGLLLFIVYLLEPNGFQAIGLHHAPIRHPLLRGLLWSLGFGLVVTLTALILYSAGIDPLRLISTKLPPSSMALATFFLVGGLISPVAEEMFFRGILFGYLRRWGAWVAVGGSTLLFVLAHAPGRGVPLPQLVGGLLFALAYEKEKNLLVPITIHVLGNLAIFSLSILS
jgi:membrane protease YdiL (CAAX protease family)